VSEGVVVGLLIGAFVVATMAWGTAVLVWLGRRGKIGADGTGVSLVGVRLVLALGMIAIGLVLLWIARLFGVS